MTTKDEKELEELYKKLGGEIRKKRHRRTKAEMEIARKKKEERDGK